MADGVLGKVAPVGPEVPLTPVAPVVLICAEQRFEKPTLVRTRAQAATVSFEVMLISVNPLCWEREGMAAVPRAQPIRLSS